VADGVNASTDENTIVAVKTANIDDVVENIMMKYLLFADPLSLAHFKMDITVLKQKL
jgi:hypothetical protein